MSEDLTKMTLPELAQFYNGLVEEALKRGHAQFEAVKRFSDKPSALRRIARVQDVVGPTPVTIRVVGPVVGEIKVGDQVSGAGLLDGSTVVAKILPSDKPRDENFNLISDSATKVKTMRDGTKQARVLRLIALADGIGIAEIAKEVGTSEREIRHHLHNLKKKFGVGHVVHGDGTIQVVLPSGTKWSDYVKSETEE